MPEFPDVARYKQYFDATSLRQRVDRVVVKSDRVLEKGVSKRKLADALKGRRFRHTRQHGKHLLVELDDGRVLTMHFGMTGRLAYFKDLDDDPKHDRIRFDFDNGRHLAYISQRLFGRVGLADDPDEFISEKKLGPDPMASGFGFKDFRDRLRRKHGAIKPALMDQALFAGIGNIYSDEILFQAGIHPDTRVERLDDDALKRLFNTLRRVMNKAAEARPDEDGFLERLPRGWLLPHREKGGKCPRCGAALKRHSSGSRTGYFCPRNQKKG